MNRTLLVILAGCIIGTVRNPVEAQGGGIKLSDVAGTWVGRSMAGPKDSVFSTWVLTATGDRQGWTFKRPKGDPYPMRIITVGGDSVVTEVGPYPSILRPGQTATTRFVGHYHGSKMTGTFEAHYPSGDVVKGKVAATRKK